MLHSLIALKPRDVPLRVALRNTFAVVAPLAVGVACGHAALGLAMATGALNTMFSDQPGPYRARMQRMLMAALAAGTAALLGMLIGAHTPALALAALLLGLGGGLLVALGPVAARVGLTSMILLVVSADVRLPPLQSVGVAALIFAGGVLQMLMALAAWPLQRYRPERFALAELMRQLAGIARQRPSATLAPPATEAVLEAMVMLHGEHRARGLAVQSFRIIAELCERVRIDLLSLGDLHARIERADARDAIERVLAGAERILQSLANAIRAAEPLDGVDRLAADFGERVAALAAFDLPEPRDRRLLRIAVARSQSLAGQLRSLLRNSDWASSRGEIRAELAEARLPAALRPGNPLRTLRANLALSSVAMRHAIRCAVCLGAAVACERLLRLPHGVWIPMTAAIVLKPDFGGTLRFGLLRVAGTFIGLLLITLIAHYAMDGIVLRLLLMALLCLGFRLLAQMNYGLGVAMLTGMLVLLLSFEGIAPGDAIRMRIVGTLLGSALALIAYMVWPTWEGRRSSTALAGLIESYRAHVRAVLTDDIAALHETRTAARAARTQVLASLERLRAEPKRAAARADLARAESFLANAHRLIRASLSLEALLRDYGRLPQSPEITARIRAFADDVDRALAAVADALRSGDPPPAFSPRQSERRLADALAADPTLATAAEGIALADTCDRIADSVDTLTHLLRPADTRPAAAVAVAAG